MCDSNTTTLFDHLYADTSDLKIYIVGGSFRTVPTQVIYSASFDVFPLGCNIAGMIILAPFPPFRIHKDYTKTLSWHNWIGVSPLTKYLPITTLLALAMGSKLKTANSTEQMLRQALFDQMDEAGKEKFEAHCQKTDTTPPMRSKSGLEKL